MQQFAGQLVQVFSMNTDSLFALSQSAATILLTAIWQGAIVAAALTICIKLAPRIAAAYRFAIWGSAFVALVCLPVLSLNSLLNSLLAPATDAVGILHFSASAKPLLILDARWSLAIAALWLAASLYRAIDLAAHSIRLRQLWKSATPVALNSGHFAALQVRGRKRVQICSTVDIERPGVIGFFAPRILIPEWLLARLTAGELDQIVLHETEHLRRGDDWTNLLQKLALVLFPLNPALLWIERQLCLEREMACDEGVIRITSAPRAYAACLASIAERRLERRMSGTSLGMLSLGAWQRRPELARRVHSILLRKRAVGVLAARSFVAALALILTFGSVELARCPKWIAFASSPSAYATLQPTPSSVEQRLDAAYRPGVQNMRSGFAQGAYLTNLKAVLPANPAVDLQPVSVSKTGRPKTRAVEQIKKVSLTADNSQALQVDPLASQPGWIVLTAWEEVSTSQPGLESDQADTIADESGGTVASHTATRMTVTQMVFRVSPATLSTTRPPSPAMQVRSGWLVLQM